MILKLYTNLDLEAKSGAHICKHISEFGHLVNNSPLKYKECEILKKTE
jgi:hypothetical protein